MEYTFGGLRILEGLYLGDFSLLDVILKGRGVFGRESDPLHSSLQL